MSIINEQRAPAVVGRIRAFFPEVNRVADSTKSLKVTVTEKDCKSAKEKKEDDCAMAHALERELKCDGAIVRKNVAYIIKGDLAIKYQVPGSVSREIVSFDRNHDFRPGEYQLSAVYKCRRADYKPRSSRGAAARKHNRTRIPLVSHITDGVRGVKAKA